jgi:hypothetical protein
MHVKDSKIKLRFFPHVERERVLFPYVYEFDEIIQRRRMGMHVASSKILHYLDTFISYR